MSDVQFEENLQAGRPNFQGPEDPILVRLLIKFKIVQDVQQGNKVLLGIAIGAFILTLIVIKMSFFSTPSFTPPAGGAIPGANPAGLPGAIPSSL